MNIQKDVLDLANEFRILSHKDHLTMLNAQNNFFYRCYPRSTFSKNVAKPDIDFLSSSERKRPNKNAIMKIEHDSDLGNMNNNEYNNVLKTGFYVYQSIIEIAKEHKVFLQGLL